MGVFGVFLVRIFPHTNWMRKDAKYLSVFSPNAGKNGPEKNSEYRHISVCELKSSLMRQLCKTAEALVLIFVCSIWVVIEYRNSSVTNKSVCYHKDEGLLPSFETLIFLCLPRNSLWIHHNHFIFVFSLEPPPHDNWQNNFLK